MPALQSLVLTDRATTPVNHTFTPDNVSDGIGTVVETTGVAIGNNTITVSSKKTTGGRRKAVVRGTFPIVVNQTINGVTTAVVDRMTTVTFEFLFAPNSTLQERKDAVGMMQSALDSSKTLINDAVVNQQGVWG